MIEFKLPSLGADMDDGTLVEWKVQPGDPVKKGQVVAVVDTSKAAVDVESWQEGTVAQLLVAPGEKSTEMRKTIAAAMARSKREIPHYYVAETIPMAKALAWLAEENARRAMPDRLLPAALLIKAVAVGLKRFPELNGFLGSTCFWCNN